MPASATAPTTLTDEYIAERWPELFHTTDASAWPSIRNHGLLSVSALLELFEISGAQRTALESRRRPESVTIEHEQHGTAVIRDNRTVTEKVLRRNLVGMTEPEWYQTLNRRVFFWLSRQRLDGLRTAKHYRGRPQAVLTIDTAKLLARHRDRVELSPYNRGAVHPGAQHSLDARTFASIAQYPFAERRRARSAQPIAELTVLGAVPDIVELITNATIIDPSIDATSSSSAARTSKTGP